MINKYFEIGQIVNTFGIKGEVKVNPFTDDISQFEKWEIIYIKDKGNLTPIKIEGVKYQKNVVILKLEGIDKIEDAEKYRNDILLIDREHAKKLPEGKYFIADLIGLDVYTDEGILLGKVDDIYNTGATTDTYVIKDELGKQILLPGSKEVIKSVDLDSEKIIVHIIKGLLD